MLFHDQRDESLFLAPNARANFKNMGGSSMILGGKGGKNEL